MHEPHCTRRRFLSVMGAAPFAAGLAARSRRAAAASTWSPDGTRQFHICLSPQAIAADPALLPTVKAAGVTDIWQPAYFYGHWYETPERLAEARKVVEGAGLRWHLINVPLGHPGDSLGDPVGESPLTPPGSWRMAQRPDGSQYSGTSLHPPATEENVGALQQLAALQPDALFLDDDFRLAVGPGVIGGCFCAEHRAVFLAKHGYGEAQWVELLDAVNTRRLTPVLRAWVEDQCDALTGSFRAQQAALPGAALGNMIMYLGAEKAGIRLTDYAVVPFRVGELMFSDASFGTVKGKTDELFSALFHRRFARRNLAFSETTAYPHDQLSARNLAAKLTVSTLSDVPNTMFMSGLTPYPIGHWETVGPAVREQATLHAQIAGHVPRGPMKHYWGEASRYVGDDRPNSLFLALGIPFEVADALPEEGVVFLGDQDAQHLAKAPKGATVYCRPEVAPVPEGVRTVAESLDALWAVKRELLAGTPAFPHVVEEVPVVCAWYPTASRVMLWNLGDAAVTVTVREGARSASVSLGGLGIAVVAWPA
jgi:hypothetical protein